MQQDNLKRMLAYSSVAHAGYMLIGVAVARYLPPGAPRLAPGGVEAVLFYLVAYGAMTVGAFAVVSYLSTPERPVENVDDLAGLSASHPGIALLMVVFLFSLIGMPPMAGFWGKLMLFFGPMALKPELNQPATLFRVLALIGALNAAIGAWYYLRIAAVMYLRGAVKPLPNGPVRPALAAVCLCALVTVGAGLYPLALWRQSHEAVPRPMAAHEASSTPDRDAAGP